MPAADASTQNAAVAAARQFVAVRDALGCALIHADDARGLAVLWIKVRPVHLAAQQLLFLLRFCACTKSRITNTVIFFKHVLGHSDVEACMHLDIYNVLY